MVLDGRSVAAIVLRFIGALGLLGCPAVGSAQGTWSVISALQKPGEVASPAAMATDAAGRLYIADYGGGSPRIQTRDTQGNWSVIAAYGRGTGQVSKPAALAVDTAGNLYVADQNPDRIQKRDAQGNWSVVATPGRGLGQVEYPSALAADAAGNLYVADGGNGEGIRGYRGRIQKRDVQGNWSILAPQGASALAVDGAGNLYVAPVYAFESPRLWKRDPQGHWWYLGNRVGSLAMDAAGSLYVASGGIQKRDAQGNWSVLDASHSGLLAVDTAGNLYAADQSGGGRIQKRDAQGNWSVIASRGSAPGQVYSPGALAVDAAGNLYVEENGWIQKRDTQGNWSVIATDGPAIGQVGQPTALAADAAGNLYVAEPSQYDDSENIVGGGRIQKRDAQGNWSVIATYGTDLRYSPSALAVDGAGNLYVAADGVDRAVDSGIEKRDAQGNWSVLATVPIVTGGDGCPWVRRRLSLAADTAGNLYVALGGASAVHPECLREVDGWIEKRYAQGNWSGNTTYGSGLGEATDPRALAVDTAGNLYVAENYYDRAAGGFLDRIQKRDAQGNWSVVATQGIALGQVNAPSGLAVDGAGNLYVADTGNHRVQKYVPGP